MRALLLLLIASAPALAQVHLPHSGYLLDADDRPATGDLAMKFEIWSLADGGTRAWASAPGPTDPACTVSVRGGYFSVVLGDGCGAAIPTEIFSSDSPRFLAISVAAAVLAPRVRIAPAASAALARKALDLDCVGCVSGAETSGVALLSPSSAQAGSLNVTGEVRGATLAGNGAQVTQLAADALATGTIPDARLPAGVVRVDPTTRVSTERVSLTNAANTFSGTFSGTFNGGMTLPLDGARTSCVTGERGSLYFNTSDALVYVCDGSAWKRVSVRAPQFDWGASSGAFGTLTALAVQRTVTLRNIGDSPIFGVGVAVSGTGFALTSTTCGTSLAAAAECTVTLESAPNDTPGARSANVVATASNATSASLPLSATYTPYRSCKEIKDALGVNTDTSYWIDPDGTAGANAPFQAYCDMQNGGWTRCLSARYWTSTKPPSWAKNNWVIGKWRTGSSWVLDATSAGTNFGAFCSDLKNISTQIMGESTYPASFGTGFRTQALTLTADFFAGTGMKRIQGTTGNNAIAIDSSYQGISPQGCTTAYTSNTNSGQQSFCISNDTYYQSQHTGWLLNQYTSCPDAPNQPCYCTQSTYCGGTNLNERNVVMMLYLR